MKISLKVKRFDPQRETENVFDQDYTLDVPDHFTVLDALIEVRESVDETLAFRCSCRAAICGSCAMRVNGHAGLACKIKLTDAMRSDQSVTVEPAGNLPVVRDLVVDMVPFWDKVQSISPWIQPEGPEPEAEYVVSNDAMSHLNEVMGCIMCGACVSDCTVLEVDKNFLGPAALAKAYRFVADPRDGAVPARLAQYQEPGGVWDCTRCFECVQACPKGVAPMERIMVLREHVLQAGHSKTYGARHTQAFEKLVAHSGRLDELKLVPMTFGFFNLPKLIGMIPVAIRAAVKFKTPPLIHKPVQGVEKVRRLVKNVKAFQDASHGDGSKRSR
jgi:succinate dehydrogenase / fumarate reductase iron-sulfur subunit